ncbi:MAG: 50S ribosomal protein L4 [Gemmatimonadota bacterium]
MAEVTCYALNGEERGTVELPTQWFDAEINRHALYQATRAERTNQRAGTASTLTRAEVRGGGAKPWRQKGTGRARAGSNRSPLWTGGGVIHGPRPKNWHEKVPLKVRRTAFASALTDKAREGAVRIVELESFEEPKTKRLVEAFGKWDAADGRKVLFLTVGFDDKLYRSARNVAWLSIKRFADASALDVVLHDLIVVENKAWETRGAPREET